MRDLTKEVVWCNLSDEVIARNLGCGWGRPFAALDNRHPHSVFYCLERRAKAPVFAAAVYLLYVCQCVPKLSGGCIRFPCVDLSQGPPGLQYLRRTKNHGQDGCKNRSNYDLGGFAEGSQAGLAVQLELCGVHYGLRRKRKVHGASVPAGVLQEGKGHLHHARQ